MNKSQCKLTQCQLKQLLHYTPETGVTGVHRNKLTGKWEVFINSNRTRHYLGLFNDFFEAVCARKSAEVKHGFHVNHGSVRPL